MIMILISSRAKNDSISKKMLKELIEEMSIDDVKLILNVKGYALLTRSESEAIIDYVGIKSMLGEVFK